MSAAESEVAEAIVETEQPEQEESGFDMQAGVDSIAQDLFGVKPDDNGETDEEVVEEGETEAVEKEIGEKEPEEEVEEKPEPRAAPQSWKKEMHESWGKLDPDTQEYIELRESQMKEGVEVKKDDADLGMRMRDAFTPYANVLKQLPHHRS